MKLTFSLLALLLCLACSGASEAPQAKKLPVPVTTAVATLKNMPRLVEAPGMVEPIRTVTIIARVTGQLEKIGFQEGQDVEKGAVLFVLDQAPFRIKAKEAEARLVMEKAMLKFLKSEALRYGEMHDERAVSMSDIEKTRADAERSEASISATTATLEKARLDIGYCTIKAPFSGRTGRFLVHEGTMVEANETELVVINQLSPIRVRFAVPERYLPAIQRYMKQHPLKVLVFPEAGSKHSHEGSLIFLNNAIDPDAGMILLKAEFENVDKTLWPGQYVRVSLILDMEKDAVTVPSNAVMNGQNGQYLFVVNSDMTVTSRQVKVDRNVGDEAVIERGLEAGETVVLSGQNKLQNGFKIKILPTPDRKTDPLMSVP